MILRRCEWGWRRVIRRAFTLAFTATCFLGATHAHASPLFELVGGVGDQGGLNGRVAASGASAAYFNPALLPKARAGFQTATFILNDAINITLSDRGSVDVPASYRGATHADGSVFEAPALPTAWLRDGCGAPECTPLELQAQPRQSAGSSNHLRAYQAIGLVTPLIGDKLVLGFYGIIPLAKFTTANSFFSDEREQFFTNSLHAELYSDRLTATSLAFALGSQISRRLSIGVAGTLGLRTSAIASTFVGNPDKLNETLVLTTNVGVETSFSPHIGLNYDVTDTVHLTATAHSVQRFDIESGLSALLPNGSKQPATRNAVHDYVPWQFGVGGRWDVVSAPASSTPGATSSIPHTLSLVATATLGLWSRYIDRQGDRPSGPYAWNNTVNLGTGARYGYGRFQSFFDVLYVPSPVPMQSGRTNYVDNNRLSTSTGFDYRFELMGVSWRAGIQGQLHFLMQRDHVKLPTPSSPTEAAQLQRVRDEFPDDAINTRGQPIAEAAGLQTNNPGAPGFGSNGLLLGGGLTLAMLFQ